MPRFTTFRFTLDPTVEQRGVLLRHVGASRFAYNQCLRFVEEARAARKTDRTTPVPRSGYDLIKRFNAWKTTEGGGRVFEVSAAGVVTKKVTGLAWRREVYQQVFEEAAVDLGRAIKRWSDARKTTDGPPVGFPRRRRRRGAQTPFGSATSFRPATDRRSGSAR